MAISTNDEIPTLVGTHSSALWALVGNQAPDLQWYKATKYTINTYFWIICRLPNYISHFLHYIHIVHLVTCHNLKSVVSLYQFRVLRTAQLPLGHGISSHVVMYSYDYFICLEKLKRFHSYLWSFHLYAGNLPWAAMVVMFQKSPSYAVFDSFPHLHKLSHLDLLLGTSNGIMSTTSENN